MAPRLHLNYAKLSLSLWHSTQTYVQNQKWLHGQLPTPNFSIQIAASFTDIHCSNQQTTQSVTWPSRHKKLLKLPFIGTLLIKSNQILLIEYSANNACSPAGSFRAVRGQILAVRGQILANLGRNVLSQLLQSDTLKAVRNEHVYCTPWYSCSRCLAYWILCGQYIDDTRAIDYDFVFTTIGTE